MRRTSETCRGAQLGNPFAQLRQLIRGRLQSRYQHTLVLNECRASRVKLDERCGNDEINGAKDNEQ